VSAETTPIQKGPIDHDVLQADRGQSVLFLSMRDQPSVTGKAMRRRCRDFFFSTVIVGTWSWCPHTRSLLWRTPIIFARPRALGRRVSDALEPEKSGLLRDQTSMRRPLGSGLAAHPVIIETYLAHSDRLVDVAQIDHDPATHHSGQLRR
jgi:hypothetical protein